MIAHVVGQIKAARGPRFIPLHRALIHQGTWRRFYQADDGDACSLMVALLVLASNANSAAPAVIPYLKALNLSGVDELYRARRRIENRFIHWASSSRRAEWHCWPCPGVIARGQRHSIFYVPSSMVVAGTWSELDRAARSVLMVLRATARAGTWLNDLSVHDGEAEVEWARSRFECDEVPDVDHDEEEADDTALDDEVCVRGPDVQIEWQEVFDNVSSPFVRRLGSLPVMQLAYFAGLNVEEAWFALEWLSDANLITWEEFDGAICFHVTDSERDE